MRDFVFFAEGDSLYFQLFQIIQYHDKPRDNYLGLRNQPGFHCFMSMHPNSLRASSNNTGVAGVGSALAHAAEAAAAAAEAQGGNGRTSKGFTKKQEAKQTLLSATLGEKENHIQICFIRKYVKSWRLHSVKLTAKTPENGWLEYTFLFPVGFRPSFRWRLLLVLGRLLGGSSHLAGG